MNSPLENENMKVLWFIRHAQSLSNAGQATETPHGIGLSAKGVQQAESLAEGWDVEPNLMVMSKYARTGLTAEPMQRKYPQCPVMTLPVHEFTFLAPASYAGTTEAERRVPVLEYFERAEPDYCDGEGAESFRSFFTRVEKAVTELIQRPEQRIQVFCHGYVIKAVHWRHLNPGAVIDSAFMRRFLGFHRCTVVENAGIHEMRALPDGTRMMLAPRPPHHQHPRLAREA